MKQKAVTHTKWQIRNTVSGNSFINRQILPSCILSNSALHNLRIFINTIQVNRIILKLIPEPMGRAWLNNFQNLPELFGRQPAYFFMLSLSSQYQQRFQLLEYIADKPEHCSERSN